MAGFGRDVLKRVYREELRKANLCDHEGSRLLKRAKRSMRHEISMLDETSRKWLARALEYNQPLNTVYAMKQRLQDIWQRSTTTQEPLLQALDEWCRQAEATGIQALREFSYTLRTYALAPAAA
jgi:stearoyl-CoA desaturase (delta-9 desaturase)